MEQTQLTRDFIETIDNLLKTGRQKSQKVIAKALQWSESGLSAVMARKRNVPFEYAYNLYNLLKKENLIAAYPDFAQHYTATPDPYDNSVELRGLWKVRERELENRLMKLEAAMEIHEAYIAVIRKTLTKEQQRQIDFALRNREEEQDRRMVMTTINSLNRDIIQRKFDPKLISLHSGKERSGEIVFNSNTGLFEYHKMAREEKIKRGEEITQRSSPNLPWPDSLEYKEIIPGQNYMIDPRYPLDWVPPFLLAEKDDRWVVAFGYRIPEELREEYENKEWQFFYESSEKWSAKNGNLPDKLKGTDHKSVIAYILQWLQEGGNPFELELLRKKAIMKIEELRRLATMASIRPSNTLADSVKIETFTTKNADTKPDTDGGNDGKTPPHITDLNIELE